MTAATVRRCTACRSAGAVTMDIMSTIITTTTAAPPTTVIPPPAATAKISAVAHETNASRQSGHHGNGQPDFDAVTQNIHFISTGQ